MHRVRTTLVFGFLTAALTPAPARACAFAYEDGRPPPRIHGEEALIVWDATAGIEHFIRSARFGGATRAFAFLVPTPGRPELAEADDRLFRRLAALYQRPPAPIPILDDDSSGGRAKVRVVERKRVAGLDAVVLQARDAGALSQWLRKEGFSKRPDLDAWLAPYVSRAYYLTAFRYQLGSEKTITSHAVRLSFRTERPFYPYAEPGAGGVDGSRRFRLTVVAPWRAVGREGDEAWEARTGYADRPAALARTLGGAVPSGAGPWMTTFEERPSRRGSADLFFVAAPEQRRVAASLDADED
jgi:hypothetical protein